VKDKNVLSSRNTLEKKGRMMVPECDPREIEAFIKKQRKDSWAGLMQGKPFAGKKIVRPLTSRVSAKTSP
jgi:hypothetical protein